MCAYVCMHVCVGAHAIHFSGNALIFDKIHQLLVKHVLVYLRWYKLMIDSLMSAEMRINVSCFSKMRTHFHKSTTNSADKCG